MIFYGKPTNVKMDIQTNCIIETALMHGSNLIKSPSKEIETHAVYDLKATNSFYKGNW